MKLSEAMKRAVVEIGRTQSRIRFDTLRALEARGLIRKAVIPSWQWVLSREGLEILRQLREEEKGEKR